MIEQGVADGAPGTKRSNWDVPCLVAIGDKRTVSSRPQQARFIVHSEATQKSPQLSCVINSLYSKMNPGIKRNWSIGVRRKHEAGVVASSVASDGAPCGSIPGYYDFLKRLSGKSARERKATLDWCGGPYDPDDIDEQQIKTTFEQLAPNLADNR